MCREIAQIAKHFGCRDWDHCDIMPVSWFVVLESWFRLVYTIIPPWGRLQCSSQWNIVFCAYSGLDKRIAQCKWALCYVMNMARSAICSMNNVVVAHSPVSREVYLHTEECLQQEAYPTSTYNIWDLNYECPSLCDPWLYFTVNTGSWGCWYLISWFVVLQYM